MTYEESTDVLALIYAYYSSHFKNFSETNASAVAFSWSVSFREVPVEIMYIAVMKWMDTHIHPPKVCEIKNVISGDLYYEAEDALAKHKKYNNLTEKALAKYQYVFEVATKMRSNKHKELTLSNFINNDGDFLLYGNTGKERLLE